MAKFDDIKDKGVLANRGAELVKRREERLRQRSVEEVRVSERIAKDLEEIDQIQANREMAFADRLDRIQALGARVQELRKVQSSIERGRTHGAQKAFMGSVQTALSQQATTSDVSSLMRSTETLGPALERARTMSTAELEARASYSKTLLSRQRDRILATAEHADDPRNLGKFQTQMNTRERLIQDVAQAQRAIQLQGKFGIDTASRYHRAAEITQQVVKQKEQMEISADVAAGRVKKSDVESNLQKITEKLIESFNRLDKAISSNAGNAHKLAEEFDELAGQYNRQVEIQREMRKQGITSDGGGPGGLARAVGFMQGTGQILQSAGSITGAVAGYQQFANVNARFQDLQNRISFGEITNQRFQDVRGAAGGDVASLRRVLSDSFADAVKESVTLGQEQKDVLKMQQGAAGAAAGGGLLEGIANILTMAIPGGAAVSGAKMAAAGGKAAMAGQAAQGAMSTGANIAAPTAEFMRVGKDIEMGLSQAQVTAQRMAQVRQMQDVMSQISDISGQKTMDTFKSLTLATRGLGVGNLTQTEREAAQQPVEYRGTGLLGGQDAVAVREGRVLQSIEDQHEHDHEREKLERAAANFVPSEKSDAINKAAQVKQQKELGLTDLEYQKYQAGTKNQGLSFSGMWEHVFGVSEEKKKERIAAGAEIIAREGIPVERSPETAMAKEEGLFDPLGGAGQISSGFGHRHPPTAGASSYHRGLDMKAKAGTPIYSAAAGKVKHVAYQEGGAGNYVTIEDEGKEYQYFHMRERPDLKVGQEIKRGQEIGKVGSTGASSGAHLHFGMIDKSTGKHLDPANYLDLVGRKGGAPQYVSPMQREPSGLPGDQMRTDAIRTTETRGGGDRENALRQLMDPGFMGRISERAGISQNDLPKIVAGAVSGLGKEFAKDVEGTLMRAGETSRAGYFQSPEQYIQARSALTGVGGKSEDLERIMRNAVAAGMDSSKNIMEMVAATQTLSNRSAQMGVDTVVGASEMMGKGIQDLVGAGVSRNMAAQAALAAGQKIDETFASGELTLGNVLESAKIEQAFGGRASFDEMETMRTLSAADLTTLSREGVKGAAKLGLKGVIKSQEDVDRLISASELGARTDFFGVGRDSRAEDIRRKQAGGESLNEEERDYLQQANIRAGRRSGVSGIAAAGMMDIRRTAKEGELEAAPTGLAASGERTLAAGGISDAGLFKEGVAQFTNAMGGIQALGKNLENIAKIDPSAFASQTAEAMKSLTVPISTFSTTMTGLNNNMSRLVEELHKLIGAMNQGGNKGSTVVGPSLNSNTNTGGGTAIGPK